MRIQYLECDCSDASHIIRIYQDDLGWGDGDEPFLMVETQLKPHTNNFFSRLKLAFLYLIGKTNTNNWTSAMLNKDQVEQLYVLTHQFKASSSKYEKEFVEKILGDKDEAA